MPRYIDADELQSHIERKRGMVGINARWTEGYNDAINRIKSMVHSFKAADVQEVRHGRWITSEITMDLGCTSCSCCHSEYYIGDLQNLEGNNDFVMYCPNCGARMDGDE